MEEMILHLEPGKRCFGINLVDGPQGPIGRVKPGSIRIAQKSGAWIVPVYFRTNRAWQLKSWDRFIIPKPFSRVKMIFGDPVKVDKGLNHDEFEASRHQLEITMRPNLLCDRDTKESNY